MSKTIAILNHKGGVAKTTTVVNLAYSLSKSHRKKVLTIDGDPQGNLSLVMSDDHPDEHDVTIANIFTEGKSLSDCAVRSKYKNIDLIPSNILAAAVGLNLHPHSPKRYAGLSKARDEAAESKYDYTLIDTPPSLDSIYFVNALIAADYYIVPIGAEDGFALSGVSNLFETIKFLADDLEQPPRFLGILITQEDKRTIAAQTVATAAKSMFGPDNILKTRIPKNTQTAGANLGKMAIGELSHSAPGAKAYRSLAPEIIKRINALEG